MALQGSIDTFALDDVLRLVATTAKTGRLTLRGTRGVGELVVRDGHVLGGSVTTDDRVHEPHELVFELLRFEDGDFVFDAAEVDRFGSDEPADVETAARRGLGPARRMARDRSGRPQLDSVVSLAPDGPEGTVKIDARSGA